MLHEVRRRVDTARLSPLARNVRRRNLTYLTPQKLRALETSLREVRNAGVQGDFLEFGVALGGSAILIASHVCPGFAFHGYDVFGMIPPPGPDDDERSHERYEVIRSGTSQGIGGEVYYGYVDDLYDRVCGSMAAHGYPVDGERVVLHRGLFEETLDPNDLSPVAFAHIDCDWYAPVHFCLTAIRDRLMPGARIVLDDYNDYGGCRRAVDAVLAEDPRLKIVGLQPTAVLELV